MKNIEEMDLEALEKYYTDRLIFLRKCIWIVDTILCLVMGAGVGFLLWELIR